ncbi:MAG: TonB-dependent receptor [Thiobacillaceae bacterium]
MFRRTLIASGIALMLASPVYAADDLTAIRAEIDQLKQQYEKRITDLETGLQNAEAKADAAQQAAQQATEAAAAPPPAPPARSNSFNPDISMILDGRYANLGKPASTEIGGFLTPAGQDRPPKGFSVDGTEISLGANIDPWFKGFANIAVADESTEVEEAWFQTLGLGNGFNIKGGRFLSAMGYQNEQHAHAWDFVDNNLVYKSLFGEHYVQDGLQFKWLAPTDLLIEPFVELGRGANFPGTGRDTNGAGAVTTGLHLGGDVNDSNSWRGGVSYFSTRAENRSFDGTDPLGTGVTGEFNGNSKVWLADFVWKWAPNGNPYVNNFKFASEYFHRDENGTLACADADPANPSACTGSLSGPYASSQSGFYAQGAYQFMPLWRVGYRYDKLYRGSVDFNGADIGTTIATLGDYSPSRHSLMLDWSPSEFTLMRLQYSLDKSTPGQDENQWFLQYIYSLGTHGAHKF